MAPSATTTYTEEYETIALKSIYENHIENSSTIAEYGGHSLENSKSLVRKTLKDRIKHIDTNACEAGEEDAFFVADLGEVYRQHLRWKLKLKRVKPHYAVKCNPDPKILSLLASLGTGFDCASKAEIESVLALDIDPSRIIYAQPCKTKSYVRFAANAGVKQMTFDNADELYKTKALFPDAELFLRILTDDSSSLCRLSLKFGASLDTTRGLLELAKELDLNVVGVSFHVGSGASDPQSFVRAVNDSRTVFDQAADVGYDLRTLDVGGGFVSDSFDEMACVLSEALDECFPPYVRIIGEPGRYYVSSAFTLACNVIARRDLPDPETGDTSYMLYLNDGVYGNFSSIIFDHQHPIPLILKTQNPKISRRGGSGEGLIQYSIWGPTCDGIDCITERCAFDRVLDVGDWLFFEEMGAYTKCSATRFNGFTDKHEVIYVCSEVGARAIMEM